MSPGGIVVVAEHLRGELADITLEMLACGRELADASGSGLICVVLTSDPGPFKALPFASNKTIIVKDPILGAFNPEAYTKVLSHLLKDLSPRLVLMGSTSIGMDLAGSLSVALGATTVGNCTRIELDGGKVLVTSKLYGGKLTARSEVEQGMVLCVLMSGSYPKEGGTKNVVPEVEIRDSPVPLTGLRIQFRELVEPDAADVDLTKVPVLVGAGRGVQGADNVKALTELAELLGGAVCGTRPVVDQGWLPRTRQVGRSGAIVKPRLYLALGISGAPEHVEGMKDSELIVAVNTDPDAPIFEVAHYGTTLDVQDLVPVLTEKIKESKGGA
jgi:electron transfer flavoprotein alpha subunit